MNELAQQDAEHGRRQQAVAQLQPETQWARIAELESRLAELDRHNAELESELARRGVKLSCARVALARATLAFDAADAERRRAEAQLVLTEKVASTAQLAAGVAHELNTPIGAIASARDTLGRALGRLGEVMEQDGLGERHPQVARLVSVIDGSGQVIGEGTTRVEGIARRLSAFTSLDQAERQRVDVNGALGETLDVLRSQLPEGVEVETRFAELPRLACQPRALKQDFLNLLHNAIADVAGHGRITIATELDGGRVRISIADDGTGIEPGRLETLFDPGFTTREGRVGAGLGLPICARVMQDHHGEIAVESTPGEGSLFRLWLPLG